MTVNLPNKKTLLQIEKIRKIRLDVISKKQQLLVNQEQLKYLEIQKQVTFTSESERHHASQEAAELQSMMQSVDLNVEDLVAFNRLQQRNTKDLKNLAEKTDSLKKDRVEISKEIKTTEQSKKIANRKLMAIEEMIGGFKWK